MLSGMLLVCCVIALVAALAPVRDDAPVTMHAVLAACAAAFAATAWMCPRPVCIHAALAALVVGSSVVFMGATGAGAAGTAVTLVWIPAYAAFFLSPRAAYSYVALLALASAAALNVNPVSGAWQLWFLTMLTTGASTHAVTSAAQRLRKQATTDPLTGALNRAGLTDAYQDLQRQPRSEVVNTIVIVDLDGFKLVNDELGHAAGDRLLTDLAQCWRPLLRADDLLTRWGGDEFVLVLRDTDRPGAESLMNRLAAVSPTSWSSGSATATASARLADLVAAADRDLYRTKLERRASSTLTRHLPEQRVATSLEERAEVSRRLPL